jgi:hypothetical protein
MSKDTRTSKDVSMGLDLGDRYSYLIGVTRDGDITVEERIATTAEASRAYFSEVPRETRIVCEAGTHSPWVSALLTELELDVVVANPIYAGRAPSAGRGPRAMPHTGAPDRARPAERSMSPSNVERSAAVSREPRPSVPHAGALASRRHPTSNDPYPLYAKPGPSGRRVGTQTRQLHDPTNPIAR